MAEEPQALSLSWVFGTATGVRHNVANLSDGYSERVCFVAAHTAVIYDKRLQRQIFLQGHCNSISCMAVTEDRSTIITADMGNESLLVLWNSKTGAVLQSIPQPHKHGIMALDISPDDDWLATIGAVDAGTGEQEIALWSLASLRSDPKTRPCVLTIIPAGDVQYSVRFNMNDMRELITNGKRRVYFWSHQYPSTHRFKYYSPPLRAKDFKQSIGDFVSSVFVPGSTQALTATSDGDLVVWDEQGITAQMGTRATDRRAIKLMRIHTSAITFLGTIGDYIVSGGEDGYIRFYDPLLRIVAWFEDLDVGPIIGIAFSAAPPTKLASTELADTINRFMAPDFVVSTRESRLIAVQSSSFEEFDLSKRRGTVVLDALLSGIADIASHPTRAEFAVLSRSGTLQRWDLVTHTCIATRSFPKMTGTKLCFSRDGSFLVAGFEAGFINIVSTEGLEDLHVGRNTSANVSMLACSTTGDQVALADDAHHVLMYALLPYKHTSRWEFVGKNQAHHGQVVGLIFGESPTGQTRLFSMGADARVVEYELGGSSPASGLQLASYKELPPNDVPTALAFAPPLKYYRHHSADTMLLACDTQFKVRMYNPDSQEQVATFLGPTFAGPIQKLLMFNSATEEAAFLAYSTAERVVGLLAWPMDGDPAKTMGLIAHPGAITAMSISYDGRKLLTAGADGTLNVWDIRASALSASAAAAAAAAAPRRWEHVLDNPELVADIREYFLYAQIKAQGESSMAPRAMSGKVPVSMLADLMRAAGYYPSQAEVANMVNHLNFVARSRDLDSIDEIGFEDLLCLYLNHRPIQEVSQEDMNRAFLQLGANPNTARLGREQLYTLLQQLGEPMDAQELLGIMKQLTGCEKMSQALPHMVDAPRFAADVLGFEEDKAAEAPAARPPAGSATA